MGGIENPKGAGCCPQEIPHLRGQLPGKLNLMVNLANDKSVTSFRSEWDKMHQVYDENEETCEEVVSLGPNTAPIIHQAVIDLLEESKLNSFKSLK